MTYVNEWGLKKDNQAETLDYIEHELQILSIALHPPPPLAPTEPFSEVIQQYTDTLCTTQKQSNLIDSSRPLK